MTHGCTSKQPVIQGESQEEFDELLEDWMQDYRPRGKSARMLVQEAAEGAMGFKSQSESL